MFLRALNSDKSKRWHIIEEHNCQSPFLTQGLWTKILQMLPLGVALPIPFLRQSKISFPHSWQVFLLSLWIILSLQLYCYLGGIYRLWSCPLEALLCQTYKFSSHHLSSYVLSSSLCSTLFSLEPIISSSLYSFSWYFNILLKLERSE